MAMKKVAISVLLLIAYSVTTWVARGGDPKGARAKRVVPDYDYSKWNGPWLLECRYESATSVDVVMTGPRTKTPGMVALFHSGDGDCTVGSGDKERGALLWAKVDGSVTNNADGKLVGILLHGKISFCTTDEALATAKNLTAKFECDFDGTFDPETDTITGGAKSEWYTSPDGKPENYARNSAKDPVIDVILRLKNGKGVHPQAPPDKNPTPTSDPRDRINRSLIDGLNKLIDGERSKSSGPPNVTPTPTPDTNPLLGINETLNNVLNNLDWLINGDPKSSPTPPVQNR